MFSKLTSRLTYANVMSTIAVFLAVGGGAYAAVTLPRNSVGNKQLKAGAVSSAKVRDRSLRARDFATGQLPLGARGAQGGQGPQGVPGAAGPAGPPTGPAGGDLSGSYPNPTLAASEGWHEVGAVGEPVFQNGWGNAGTSNEAVAFFRDREGIVHLKGDAVGGGATTLIFQLPAGYRPASGKALGFAVVCECQTSDDLDTSIFLPTGGVTVFGAGVAPDSDGGVGRPQYLQAGGAVSLNGITFRAAG